MSYVWNRLAADMDQVEAIAEGLRSHSHGAGVGSTLGAMEWKYEGHRHDRGGKEQAAGEPPGARQEDQAAGAASHDKEGSQGSGGERHDQGVSEHGGNRGNGQHKQGEDRDQGGKSSTPSVPQNPGVALGRVESPEGETLPLAIALVRTLR